MSKNQTSNTQGKEVPEQKRKSGRKGTQGSKKIDLIRLIKNHPEWYTKMDNSNLVNVNLSDKQNVSYPTLHTYDNQFIQGLYSIKMPSVVRIGLQLTKPMGDNGGWDTGIRNLYQQIRTSSSGQINFTQFDLERYVLTTRLLHAVAAHLAALYKATNTFTATNAALPKDIIFAMGYDPDDIMQNAADLFMYEQRFIERIRTSFPLNISLYDRTEWLLGNVFAESDGDKPGFYVPTILHTDYEVSSNTGSKIHQIYWMKISDTWESGIWGKNFAAGRPVSYSNLIDAADTLLSNVLATMEYSNIAAALIKAFGDRAFYDKFIKVDINSTTQAVYDEDVLHQFQNATVYSTNSIGITAETVPTFGLIANSFKDTSYAIGTTYTEIINDNRFISASLDAYLIPQAVEGTIPNEVGDGINQRLDTYLLNWHKDQITPGKVMSIVRFVALGETVPEDKYLALTVFGTEIVAQAVAIVHDATATSEYYTENGDPSFLPIAGYLGMRYTNATFDALKLNASMQLWSMFNYAPRLSPYLADDKWAIETIMPELLDWDTYAVVSKASLRNYNGYANQSLLYAGPSRTQANSKVYKDQKRKPDSNTQDKRQSSTPPSSEEKK